MNLKEQQTLPLPGGSFVYTGAIANLSADYKPSRAHVHFLESSAYEENHGFRPPQHLTMYVDRDNASKLAEFFADLRDSLGGTNFAPGPAATVEATQLKALQWARGHVEDGSHQAVNISQDDATKLWILRAGHRQFVGRSLQSVVEMLTEAYKLEDQR